MPRTATAVRRLWTQQRLDDVSNLGWKLAARLNGWGSDALLQTYAEGGNPIFRETAEDFILGRIRTDRDFLERYNPDRDRENSNEPGREPRLDTPRAR